MEVVALALALAACLGLAAACLWPFRDGLAENGVSYHREPVYRDFREGDVRHSLADISKAAKLLGYAPKYDVSAGVALAMPWYIMFLK